MVLRCLSVKKSKNKVLISNIRLEESKRKNDRNKQARCEGAGAVLLGLDTCLSPEVTHPLCLVIKDSTVEGVALEVLFMESGTKKKKVMIMMMI